MNKSPAFQWYPKDILASARVQMMSMSEECAYRRLIDYCWINGSVPSDASRAARLVGKGCTAEIAEVALEMFEPHLTDADKLIHDRLEVERVKQASNSKVRQAAAEARWDKQGKSADASGKQVKSKTDANAMQTDMQNDALHTSSSSSTTVKEEKTTEAVVKKKKPAATTNQISDEDWFDGLQTNIAYRHISIKTEFERAKIWCVNNNREPTRKFFVNWINRIQAPIETNGDKNNGIIQNGNRNIQPNNAGDRNTQRIINTSDFVAELRRQGELEEQTLSGGLH